MQILICTSQEKESEHLHSENTHGDSQRNLIKGQPKNRHIRITKKMWTKNF
jgi:hypothetical protein